MGCKTVASAGRTWLEFVGCGIAAPIEGATAVTELPWFKFVGWAAAASAEGTLLEAMGCVIAALAEGTSLELMSMVR